MSWKCRGEKWNSYTHTHTLTLVVRDKSSQLMLQPFYHHRKRPLYTQDRKMGPQNCSRYGGGKKGKCLPPSGFKLRPWSSHPIAILIEPSQLVQALHQTILTMQICPKSFSVPETCNRIQESDTEILNESETHPHFPSQPCKVIWNMSKVKFGF